MRIVKMAVGNAEEAFVESSFSDGINIIFSGDNNKGKTIVIQSMMYTLGNKPIFPDSFDYKNYYHYIELEHNCKMYKIIRFGDSFVVESSSGIDFLDSISEFKHFWNDRVFNLPKIFFNGTKIIVDLELYIQMFFVGQDGKDTSNIFNSGYYHKEEFKKMISSYAGEFESELSEDEILKLDKQIKKLYDKKQDIIKLSEFYKSASTATEYLSKIKDREAFQARVDEMNAINDKIFETRKKRNRTALRKSLWNGTLKDLRSLNRNIEVGELRCMDCNSNHIAYKGTGKLTYSFDVSTQEMRDQIINSINERIAIYDEELAKYDYEIGENQKKLQELLKDDNITIENILALKHCYFDVEEIEAEINDLEAEISDLQRKKEYGIQNEKESNKQRKEYYNNVLARMNEIRSIIDPDGTTQYQDLFTKRGSVASGSEETIFYASKIIAIADKTKHEMPIVMDSFRAEDLSTDKENRLLEQLAGLTKQCILTTTLKDEEKGKYKTHDGITCIDYSNHQSNKLLNEAYVTVFKIILDDLHIQL